MTKPKYKPTPLANLSKRSTEAKTLAILRVNPNICLPVNPLPKLAMLSSRTYAPHTALPPGDNVFTRPVYRSGDGDRHGHVLRAGSDAASKVGSVGYST